MLVEYVNTPVPVDSSREGINARRTESGHTTNFITPQSLATTLEYFKPG